MFFCVLENLIPVPIAELVLGNMPESTRFNPTKTLRAFLRTIQSTAYVVYQEILQFTFVVWFSKK
jgi:hypothetical protein